MATPEHLASWWGYGLFFVAAALAQLVFGLLLLTQGFEPGRMPPWPILRGRVYLAGIAGNLAIMALWVVTRTVGVPAGPEAGEVEPVGLLDGVSKALETGLVVILAVLWRRHLAVARVPA